MAGSSSISTTSKTQIPQPYTRMDADHRADIPDSSIVITNRPDKRGKESSAKRDLEVMFARAPRKS